MDCPFALLKIGRHYPHDVSLDLQSKRVASWGYLEGWREGGMIGPFQIHGLAIILPSHEVIEQPRGMNARDDAA